MRSRLCIKCDLKHQAYGFRPFCRTCSPNKFSRHTITHRVQSVDQFVTPPIQPAPVVPEQPRTLVIRGVEYDIVFSGRDSLRRDDTPGRWGCSLLDASSVVK